MHFFNLILNFFKRQLTFCRRSRRFCTLGNSGNWKLLTTVDLSFFFSRRCWHFMCDSKNFKKSHKFASQKTLLPTIFPTLHSSCPSFQSTLQNVEVEYFKTGKPHSLYLKISLSLQSIRPRIQGASCQNQCF